MAGSFRPKKLVCSSLSGVLFLALLFNSFLFAGKTPSNAADISSPQGLSGTMTVGGALPRDFANLSTAFSAVATNKLSGDLSLVLQAGYTGNETIPCSLPALSATNGYTITIYPAVSGLSISGNASGILDLNGAQHIVIDGRVGATGSAPDLVISNTNASGYAMQFRNEASNNTIKYCIIQSCNTNASSGTIYFNTTTGTGANGNDNNTIDHCVIQAGASAPTNAIYSCGSTNTIAAGNSNNVISNCSICDFFSTANDMNGIFLSSGSTDWTITGNSFYETIPRLSGTSGKWSAIQINNTLGNNFVITANYIGGQAPNASGSSMALTGGVQFMALKLFVGMTTATSIQGNTIANCQLGLYSAQTYHAAIALFSGAFACGTITGNTIGSANADNSITVSSISAPTTFSGILAGYTLGTVSAQISNNTVGGITAKGSYGVTLRGIAILGTSTTSTVSNNLVGSNSQKNSIADSTNASLYGIYFAASGSASAQIVSQNTLRNLCLAYNSSSLQLIGISVPGTPAGLYSITKNQISGLTSIAGSSGTDINAALIGIMISANSDTGHTISGNYISDLSSLATTSSANIVGIAFAGPTSGSNIIAGNFIHSFAAAISGSSLYGICLTSGNSYIFNNMVRLGIDTAGASITTEVGINGIYESGGINRFYFNSVYIGGTGVKTTANNTYAFYSAMIQDIRNNIFMNARSNASTGGKHFAINYSAIASGAISDYNILLATGLGGVLGIYNSNNFTSLNTWCIATSSDTHSYSTDPQFINPTGTKSTVDLHITPSIPTVAEGTGISIPLVTTDFDGQSRSSFTPTDIGADAGNFLPPDYTAPVISVTTVSNSLPCSSIIVNAQITDASGVPMTGPYLPRIYYLKNSGTWYSSAGVLSSGAATNGVWNFVITTSDMGGIVSGDIIYYYVTAQDIAIPPNISASPSTGFAATNVLTVSSAPASPTACNIMSAMSGTFTVGTGGAYTTITAALADYNAKMATGPITFSLTDASYSSKETFPLVIKRNAGASAVNTLTIKPAAGVYSQISGSSATSILKLSSAAYVRINGKGTNNERNLSFTNTNSSTNTTALWIGNSSVDGACAHDSIQYCSFSGQGTTTSSAALFSGSNTTLGLSAESPATDISISNCAFSNALNGILWKGNKTAGDSAIIFISNSIGGSSGCKLGNCGISASYMHNFIIAADSICGITSTGTNSVSGIFIDTSCTAGNITANQIFTISNTNSSGYGASGISLSSTAANAGIVVSNSYIRDISSYGSAAGENGYGIAITKGGGYSLYYNTVSLSTNPTATNAHPACLYVSSQITGTGALSFKNNIFYNNQTVGLPGYVFLCNATNTVFSELDYNDYYCTNPATCTLWHLGSDITTIAAWRAATGKEQHSFSADPLFHTTTNLHILPTTSSPVSGAGVPVNGIATDYDGDARDATAPDIGADEFTAKQLTLTSTPVTQATYAAVLDTVSAGGITIRPSSTGNISASFISQGRAGDLPQGISHASPYYWLLSTSRTSFTDTVKFYFDHITGSGVVNFSSLHLLRREGDGAPWHEIPTIAKTSRYIAAVLTDFSEFSLGGGDENPLPVELSSFHSAVSGSKVFLKWIAQTELNTAYYDIERSSGTASTQWKCIGRKQALSTGNAARQYSFSDTLLLPGEYNYRLKIVDNDGSFVFSPETKATVGEPNSFALIQNFPNPFNPSTIIRYTIPRASRVTLTIYDILGREVKQLVDEEKAAGYYTEIFYADNCAAGIYFYTLRAGNFKVTKKMLLVK